MTEYETKHLEFLTTDLQFRREQEAAVQRRHDETQSYGERYLKLLNEQHFNNLDASGASTAAQNARAAAEEKSAAAGQAIAAANKALGEDEIYRLLPSVIARLDDRTAPTGKINADLAVADVMAAMSVLRATFGKLTP